MDLIIPEQAEAQPSLFADVLREGRVSIYRDDLRSALQQRPEEILAMPEPSTRSTAAQIARALSIRKGDPPIRQPSAHQWPNLGARRSTPTRLNGVRHST